MNSSFPSLNPNPAPRWLALFDESILLREARRWKNQRRWLMLPAIGLIVGMMLAVALVNMFQEHPALEPSRQALGAAGTTLVLFCCLAAFLQSMQVLRHEIPAGAFEGLLLTLQKSRGVMLSVVASGMIAGLLPLVIFLPLLLLLAVGLSVDLLHAAAWLALGVSAIFLAAAIGANWFFIGQRLCRPRITVGQLLLDILAFLAVLTVGLKGAFGPPSILVMDITWISIACGLFGAGAWGVRLIFRETREMNPNVHPGAADPVHPAAARSFRVAGIAIALAVLASTWTGESLLSHGFSPDYIGQNGFVFQGSPAVEAVPHQPAPTDPALAFSPWTAACFFGYTVGSGWMAPAPIAVTGTSMSGVSGGEPDIALTIPANALAATTAGALAVALVVFLLGTGLATTACRLYRELRAEPERVNQPTVSTGRVVDVGRDDWLGFRNPIITRELRTRLRSGDARIFIVLSAIVSAAAAIVPLLAFIGADLQPTQLAELARTSFTSVIVVQLAILCLIGPGIGAEVIALEREKQTFQSLVATRLSAAEILGGKIFGCAAMLMLLICPSFPLLALASFLHGVTPWMVLESTWLLVFFVFVLSVVTVSISALAESSVTGKWIAYLLAAVLFALYTILAFAVIHTGGPIEDIVNGASSAFGVLVMGVLTAAASGFLLLLWSPAVRRIHHSRGGTCR